MINIRYRKRNGKVEFNSVQDSIQYNEFVKNVPEGKVVVVHMEIMNDDGSLSQLAKVHALIKEIATYTGHSFNDIKILVKREAGLVMVAKNNNFEVKSFGDCSRDELSLAIQAALKLAQSHGIKTPF